MSSNQQQKNSSSASNRQNDNGDIQQYKYDEMANKVLRSDRRLMDDRSSYKEPSSNPESLSGRISVKDMGKALNHGTTDKESQEIKLKEMKYAEKKLDKLSNNKNKKFKSSNSINSNILNSDILEGINYVPTDELNKSTYNLILSWCSKILDDDVSHSIVVSLADIVIEILNDESFSNKVKLEKLKETVENNISDDEFLNILSLTKELTDYTPPGENDSDEDDEQEDDENKEDGIAVIIDSDDEDDQDEEDEEEDQEEEEVDGDSDNNENQEDNENGDDDAEVLEIGSTNTNSKSKENNSSNSASSASELDILSFDKFWLTKKISSLFPDMDSYEYTELSNNILKLMTNHLNGEIDSRTFENELLELFDYENTEFVSYLIKNYTEIFYGIKFSSISADKAEETELISDLKEKKLFNILKQLKLSDNDIVDEDENENEENSSKRRRISNETVISINSSSTEKKKHVPKYIDLANLIFDQGSHLMTTTKFKLPQGSFKRARRSYEEIHIPAPKQPKLEEEERLIEITELPKWAQTAFPGNETKTLNRIQSKVYPSAFQSDENILMCAPTGAGKTNVAMLTVLRTISKFIDEDTGKVDISKFKIVYIAPLKALVQEQVREFQRRLGHFNITVNELTGDSNLTKHQISNTQILVTTPEKWDVITRKMSDISYTNLVKLVIIDEIHLLHDERGPVLESIVARSLRNNDDYTNFREPVRLIGLSATLPNYKDVSKFLRVDPSKGLFYFDATYRPCPLAQQFIGITEKKHLKRYQAMNDACYEKVLENVSAGHQVIIFVHSRKETEKTAKYIADKLVENEKISEMMNFSTGIKEILKTESDDAKSEGLKTLLPMGFGIHHAGMNKKDRSTSEDLFAQGHIRVLVSTATLAWGVNLPAHTVIVKGTNIYSPEKGSWVELSPQDILQMLGRAGRPRYDQSGEGIIITSQDEVKYYLAVLNQQLPIESQMFSKLADNLNAEIVLGTVKTISDAVDWLGQTYLYVRMIGSPNLYHVGPEYDKDKGLFNRRTDLAHSAFTVLFKNGLIKYDPVEGNVSPTELGKIASYYYISYDSMRLYNKHIKPFMTEIDIFRLFAQSGEFKYIPIREEEKPEIEKLLERAPVPISESADNPLAKINVLLQTHISRLSLDGFAMMSDMIYVVQSAGRLFRAMYEIALRKGWARLTRLLLDLTKIIERRLWLSNSPLRQFPDVPREIIHTTERSMIQWSYYLQLQNESEVAQAFRSEKFGRRGFELLKQFPIFTITANSQPITHTLLRVELEITPTWNWNTEIHGYAESFTLLVEDCDSERILYHNTVLIKKQYINQVHIVDFTVPILEPLQPNYFISLVSDKWLHCETRVPVLLLNTKVPKKFPEPTPLIELHQIPITELKVEEFESVFEFENFNKFQSQLFKPLYESEDNILIGATKGAGKTVCAELALLNHWNAEKGRAVYLCSSQTQIDNLFKTWKKALSNIAGGKVINKLTGELSSDLKLLAKSHLVLATPKQFDIISRRWQSRKNIQTIELVIADDIQDIGNGSSGTVYEITLSRMRFISAQIESAIRIVMLSTCLANGKDIADWMGISKNNIFNFSPNEREFPLEVRIQSFDINHHASLLLSMVKPSYLAVNSLNDERGEETAIVFVPGRKECIDICGEYINRLENEETSWLKTDEESIAPYLKRVGDKSLRKALTYGIGFLYKSMASSDKMIVERLFKAGVLQCVLATKETSSWCPSANAVVVLSTQEYEGKEHRYVDYSINDLTEMVGLARINPETPAKVLVLTNTAKSPYYKKFLTEALPLESHLNYFIHDAFINEISTGLISNRQNCVDWITYTFFYRRLRQNSSYYDIKDPSNLGISIYLSDLVENTLNDLAEGKLIELSLNEDDGMKDEENDTKDDGEKDEDEDDEDAQEITPMNGCMISAYYNISFITIETFTLSLTSKSRMKNILEILVSAYEYESLPIRHNEHQVLSKIYDAVPVKFSGNPDYESPSFKAFILLQAHFSRINLSHDLASDLNFILDKIIDLIYSTVDILSGDGYLNATNAMDICQMIVQGMWETESPLKQIPHFNSEILQICEEKKIETVYDIMALEDEERDEIMKPLDENQLASVAEFVNKFPNIEISYNFANENDTVIAGSASQIIVEVQRDQDMEDLEAVAARYSKTKTESWWVVIGETKTKNIYAIKKATIAKESQQIKMDFTVPTAGKHNISIWCVCDSYIDADKEISFELDVAADDSDE
ncbi:hypothetical protein B5S32_g1724 [[Candida] boidinii]|nr:hypothetical protein B5S32_g1724 [[Candida] boidinii]